MKIALSLMGLLLAGHAMAHSSMSTQDSSIVQAAQNNVVDAVRVMTETVRPAIQAAARVTHLATIA